MGRILRKEMCLSASVLSYIFIAFALMTLIPNYPILIGAFFITLGIFKSVEKWKISNDITYSVLLPISKRDVVIGKFLFALLIEMCGFAVMLILTMLRMTVLTDVDAYANGALMAANLSFLGFALIIFGCFNLVFFNGYFKTSYYCGKPFFISMIVTFAIVIFAESLHYIPGLEAVNASGFGDIGVQSAIFVIGVAVFIAMTYISVRSSVRNFERTDL